MAANDDLHFTRPTADGNSLTANDANLPDQGDQGGTPPLSPSSQQSDQGTSGIGGIVTEGDSVTTEKTHGLSGDIANENITTGGGPLVETREYEAPRSLEGVITAVDENKGITSNGAVLKKLNNITQGQICPFIEQNDVSHPSTKKGNTSKLESVGVYKTIDLISEGPIAGLCDARGNLIPIIEGEAPSNENMLKGVYLNDVPVINTYGGTLNYQRIHSEIKYGTLQQGLLQDHKQKSLSFLRSSQTFNIGLSLPGLNQDQTQAFMQGDHKSSWYTATATDPFSSPWKQGFFAVLTKPGSAMGTREASWNSSKSKNEQEDEKEFDTTGTQVHYSSLYATSIYSDTYGGSEDTDNGPQKNVVNQVVTVGPGANAVSIYTDMAGTNESMVTRMKRVFREQPVVFHHAITNDNVSDVEVSLVTDSLYLRKMEPSASKDPMNNTIFFIIRIGYENSERLIGEGGDTFYALLPISGLSTSAYERAYTFPLPIATADRDRRISICVASEEPTPQAKAIGAVQRAGGVSTITEIIEAPLTFPHSALMANLIDARSFSRVPKRTYDMKLLKIKIPANYDSENREYSGNWTGQWAPYKQWSDNPAWVFYDMMTSRRYGLQKYGFGDSIVDKWNLYSIGKYCDELVETGWRPSNTPLSFSIDPGGAVVFITDTNGLLGEPKLRSLFPEGKIISLYKLKDKDDVAINRGYRRRVGAATYDTENKIFSFSIHKIINPEYIFETYKGLRDVWYDDNNRLGPDSKSTALAWIYQYLQKEAAKNSGSDVLRDYTAGFSLGSTVRTGVVVVESNIYKPVLEPRFSTNIYLDREQDAMNCLNDLAAVFRGMVYWNSGFVFISNDQFREPVMLFNNSSVKDGVFTYTGSSKSTRFTSVLVRYNDAYDNYKPKVEYVEDAASIRKYGYLEKKIVALGTTSRSQAYRLGKWFLFTNQLETDLIQFKAGIEATYLRPGDVIKIQDSLKNTKRYGGRIKAINPSEYQLTLDRGVYEDVVGQKITLIVPSESKSVGALNEESQMQLENSDFTGIPEAKINETRATQIQQFTIAAVSGSDANSGGAQNDLITVENAEDFGKVAVGTIWSMQNTSTDTNVTEVAYRVLSVTEETSGQYAVTGMMYESSKFGAVDESRDLSPTQQSTSSVAPEGPVIGAIDFDWSLDQTQFDIVETSEVAIGDKVPEDESGASSNGAGLEEGGEKIKVTIDLTTVLSSLLDELNTVNLKRYADEIGGNLDQIPWRDAPKSGNIMIDVDISGDYTHDEVYWRFQVNNVGKIWTQTTGKGTINLGTIWYASWPDNWPQSDLRATPAYKDRYKKIKLWVPKGALQVSINVRLQDYTGRVTDSSSQIVPIP